MTGVLWTPSDQGQALPGERVQEAYPELVRVE